MQAIMETIFDVVYLVGVVSLGIVMVKNAKGRKTISFFGIMAIVLGCGDAFHLVPRIIALCTTGLADYTVALGAGKWITSITMTLFYLMLYQVWLLHYQKEWKQPITYLIYFLAFLRIILCMMPQNQWLSTDASLSWGIYRNVPFVIMGLIIIYLFTKESQKQVNDSFKAMPIAIFLSFAFYIPVVLWANTIPAIGFLMMPKTLAYVWVVLMGYNLMKKTN